MNYATLAVLATLFCLAVPLLQLSRRARRLQAEADAKGDWVAEVWLEWEICKGSTLYRARFATEERAARAARANAWVLDMVLPTRYKAEYSDGSPYWESYCYGIHFGVRKLTAYEQVNGVHQFYTDVLPGHKGHEGEHPSAHPRERSLEFSGSLAGYKL